MPTVKNTDCIALVWCGRVEKKCFSDICFSILVKKFRVLFSHISDPQSEM